MVIQSIMLVALGFLIASLFTLVFASALWKRAVRLTTERIKSSMPISVSEMQASKDQLRAEFAVRIRQYEIKLENATLKAARQLIELSRRETEITKLKSEVNEVATELEEQHNANRVLKQTISTRIPQMEVQLLKAKEMLGARYQELTRLRSTISQKEGELGEIRSAEQQRQAEIQRLKSTLENQDHSSKHVLDDFETIKADNKALVEEIKNLKAQLKEAHFNSESQANTVRKEMHVIANKIIQISSETKNDNSEDKKDNAREIHHSASPEQSSFASKIENSLNETMSSSDINNEQNDHGRYAFPEEDTAPHIAQTQEEPVAQQSEANKDAEQNKQSKSHESLTDPVALAKQMGLLQTTNSN